MTHGQEQLLVENNPHDSFKQVFVLSSHPVEVCVAGGEGSEDEKNPNVAVSPRIPCSVLILLL